MAKHGNRLFFIFAAASTVSMVVIPSQEIALAIGVPVALVVLYGLFTHWAIGGIQEAETVRHRIESVYFLGFFMTLMAMFVMFYQLSTTGLDSLLDEGLKGVFLYIGISVVSTMAGVLARNMLSGRHILRLQDPEQGLEDSYQLLNEIAHGFTRNYSQTFESIREFLDERRSNTTIFNHREKEFLSALGDLAATLHKVSADIRQTDGELRSTALALGNTMATYERGSRAVVAASEDLASYLSTTRRNLEDVPFQTINRNLSDFARQTSELKEVIDSAIVILDQKLQRVGA